MYMIGSYFVLVVGLAFVLILNVASIPISEVLGANSDVPEEPVDVEESAENVTTNGTRKDL